MLPKKLTDKVIRNLRYYVYVYVDPFTNRPFYVGKGKGNRVYAHVEDDSETEKVETIRRIRGRGREPRIDILIHGLADESMALRIESAAIDLLGVKNLTNLVRGWGGDQVGRMELKHLAALYENKPAQVKVPAILIRINHLYRYEMSVRELYEATRGVWKCGERRYDAKYAFAVYHGIVREVYEITGWFPGGTTKYRTRLRSDVDDPDRWEFTGHLAPSPIRTRYIDKSVEKYFPRHSQNPFTYVGC